MPLDFGHDFQNPALLSEALTHPSLNVSGPVRDYERLEFLGDRVLGLVVAHMLLKAFPGEQEGDLSKRHVALVRKEALARVGRKIGLDEAMKLSSGEEQGGTRQNDSVLSDVCEAVIGALYLDGGLPSAEKFIQAHWREMLAEDVSPPRDFKSALQEWLQACGKPRPAYVVVEQGGPPHAPVFMVRAEGGGHEGIGKAGTRKAAEQAAAQALLEHLEKGRQA
ncbi:MAG TPA: ribonuclease III [Rhodospirillaceae bacterium]|nr:MAG: ribonuclease III [Alphaproteobacteria bacterium GWF2_58_20]HAU28849.1 ribonuclease III [Rhodospirillaceae bacterium]